MVSILLGLTSLLIAQHLLNPVNQLQFPDYTANYITTVIEPARAVEAQKQAEVPVAPLTTVLAPPALPDNQYKAFIYQHESGNNPGAINPASGACGLGQALPCSKMPCSLSDYNCQDNFFTQYMLGTYGSWANAYYAWLSKSWW